MSEGRAVYHVHGSQAGRRPWLRCLHCGRRLVQVGVYDGRTCIMVEFCVVLDAVVLCPVCGKERRFVSVGIVIPGERAIIEGK